MKMYFFLLELLHTSSVWNSLEVIKLVVSSLTPVAVAILGVWIARHLKRVEHLQWANQKAIEKRLEVYSKFAPLLNDIYYYFNYIGEWKWKNPTEIINKKRQADKLFYVNAPLFSKSLKKEYERFINLCFTLKAPDQYDGNPLIKTDINKKKEVYFKAGQFWDPKWERFFVPPKQATPCSEIVSGYWSLTESLVRELGVGLEEKP